MKKNDLIKFLNYKNFIEYDDIYEKLNAGEKVFIDNEIYIFINGRRIIVMKCFESLKSAYNTYGEVQGMIKELIDVLEKKYRKNVYFFLCVNERLENRYIKIINLIEKDHFICKKYVIISENDFKRITFFEEEINAEEVEYYNKIKVEEVFLDLIQKHCLNKNSVSYAKEYLMKSKIDFDDKEDLDEYK